MSNFEEYSYSLFESFPKNIIQDIRKRITFIRGAGNKLD